MSPYMTMILGLHWQCGLVPMLYENHDPKF